MNGVRLDFVIAGIAAGMLANVTRLEMDGKVVYDGAGTTAPPGPGTSEEPPRHLSPSYFTSDDLKAAVLAVRPQYKVAADGAGNLIDGCGSMEPAIRYGSAPKPPDGDGQTMTCMNQDHPYWANFGMSPKVVQSMVTGAATLKGTVADRAVTPATIPQAAIPISQWETGNNTTDPVSMSFLIMYIGPGGRRSYLLAAGYRIWYYQFHGRQAIGGPKNPEAASLTDAQFQALRAFPKDDLDRMIRGEEPRTPIPA